jgi:antitoxin component HigA of HigAB toxin-antitoxin module
MRIVSEQVIERFAHRRADCRAWLENWLVIARQAAWQTIQDVKKTYPAADGGIRVRSGGAVDHMETLAQLIDDYEKGEGLKMDLSHLTPLDAVRYLMEVHGLTVTALGGLIGSQGTLCDVLSGRRQLSKAMIRKLADHFGVSPAIFL